MNEQEQRMFIRFLARRLKKYCRELTVYQIFAEQMRHQGHQYVDAVLEAVRAEPSLAVEMDRQFAWLDKLLPPSETEIQEKAWEEYLEKWQPDGEPN